MPARVTEPKRIGTKQQIMESTRNGYQFEMKQLKPAKNWYPFDLEVSKKIQKLVI